jgi:hypothetical protein
MRLAPKTELLQVRAELSRWSFPYGSRSLDVTILITAQTMMSAWKWRSLTIPPLAEARDSSRPSRERT